MEGERDDCECGGGFMELLGCADAVLDGRIQSEQGFLFSPSPSSSSSSARGSGFSQMLHFGAADGGPPHDEELLLSASCAAANERSRAKKLETHGGKRGGAAAAIGNDTVASTTTRRHRGGSAGTIKVRKEKLGDRISALQQIVSPYGKTDTATVLHEAISYIRFLHDQVQVLSSPYIHQLPLSNHNQNVEKIIGGDLSSRGLCLVPISCTENVANNNIVGADLWSPAVGGSSSSSSGSKH